MSVRNIFADESHDIYTVRTHADGPDGEHPLPPQLLNNSPTALLPERASITFAVFIMRSR